VAPPPSPADAAQTAASILIAEDDRQVREMLALALADEGFAVTTAADGQHAVTLARQQPPRLLILDWGLPVLSGAQVAAAVQAAHGDGVPLLLITADGRAAEKARQVGAQNYLHKPFDLEVLLTMVQRLLAPPTP
jgi:two-component system response regulator MprA